ARFGDLPKLDARDLVSPIGTLIFSVGIVAAISGTVAYLASADLIDRGGIAEWSGVIPLQKQRLAFAVNGSHVAAYGAGFVGGIALCIWTVTRRVRESKPNGTKGRESTEGQDMEPIAILTAIGSALGLLDKFVGLVDKLKNPNGPPHSVEAKRE